MPFEFLVTEFTAHRYKSKYYTCVNVVEKTKKTGGRLPASLVNTRLIIKKLDFISLDVYDFFQLQFLIIDLFVK